MTETITIGGLEAGLELTIEGPRPRTAATAMIPAWLTGSLSVRVGRMTADRAIAVRVEELLGLMAELEDCVHLLLGRACFRSLDESLSLDIVMLPLGRAEISGTIRLDPGAGGLGDVGLGGADGGGIRDATGCCASGVDLVFQFASDQTFLAASLADLRRVVRQYPARHFSSGEADRAPRPL